MKKTIILIALLVSIPLVHGQPTKLSTDRKYADSRQLFREIMQVGAVIVDQYEKRDLEVVKIDIDLVSKNVSKQTVKKLSRDFSYLISAVGQPSRIKDLDIALFSVGADGSTALLAKDNEIDNTPTIFFTPEISGDYIIVISTASMVSGYDDAMGFYFLAVAHN